MALGAIGGTQYDSARNALAKESFGGNSYQPPPLRARLQAQLDQTRERVEALEQAIAALDAVPGAEALLDALAKVGV